MAIGRQQIGVNGLAASTWGPGSQNYTDALLSILPGGPATSQIANPAGLTDTKGNAVTCTRASTKYCRKSTTFDTANLLQNTEQVGVTAYGWAGGLGTSNFGIAPDGTMSASRVAIPGASLFGGTQQIIAKARASGGTWAGKTVTFSVWVRSNTGSNQTFSLWVTLQGSTDYYSTDFTATSTWQRFSFTQALASFDGASCNVGIVCGSGLAAADLLCWGAKAEELALGNPNDLSGWSVAFGATVPSHASLAPDGTNTASVVQAASGFQFHGLSKAQSAVNTLATSTASAYLKAGTVRYAMLFWGNTGAGALFDLQAGTVLFSNQTASIVSGGNGYWLCTMTGTSTIGNDGPILEVYDGSQGLSLANVQWTAAGTENILAWGVRLDQGSVRGGGYTSPMLVQMAANVPSVEPEGLLVEGASTNLLLQSQDFSSVSWAKSSCSATANAAIAPDGTLTASAITFTAASASQCIQHPITTAINTTYTYSVWLWSSVAGNQVRISRSDDSTWTTATVSPTLTLTTTPTRYTLTFTTPGVGTTSAVYIGGEDKTPFVPTAATIYAWGAQLEAFDGATSYIPTTTVSATRNIDFFSVTLSRAMTATGTVAGTITPQWTGAPATGAVYYFQTLASTLLYSAGSNSLDTVIAGQYTNVLANFVAGVPVKAKATWTNTSAFTTNVTSGTSGTPTTYAASGTSGQTTFRISQASGAQEAYWIHSVVLVSN